MAVQIRPQKDVVWKAPLVVCASMLDKRSLTASSFKQYGLLTYLWIVRTFSMALPSIWSNQLNASLAPLTLVASLLDMRTYIPYFESMTRITYA